MARIKYEETHQFVINRKRERKKKNAAISGIKVQSIGKAEMNSTSLVIDADWRYTQSSSEVATSGRLKGIEWRSRQGSPHRQLRKEQKLKEDCRDRKSEVATSKTTNAIYISIR